MTELATPPGGAKSSMLSFDYTLDAAEESALLRHAGRDRAKLDALRAAGIDDLLLNGAGGSVANLRRFAREVMPGFAGEKSGGGGVRRCCPLAARLSLRARNQSPRRAVDV